MPRPRSSELTSTQSGGPVRAGPTGEVTWKALALLGILIALLCLFGIWSRPAGLASIWVANAVLLGVFVRLPNLAKNPASWIVVAVAYIAADLVTGSTLETALWLNVANLVGVAVGVQAFKRLRPIDKRLGRPPSIVFVFFATVAASAGAAVVGMGSYTQVFEGTAGEGLEIWFTAELSNFMAILPLILSAPSWSRRFDMDTARNTLLALKPALLPGVTLALCFIAWALVPEPAVIALPIPVLLWTALRAGVFATAALTLVAIGWTMLMVGQGLLEPLEIGSSASGISAFQIYLTLLAMGPIAVASSVENNQKTLVNLWLKANQDELTGVLTRQAFFERAEAVSIELAEADRPVAVAMLDLDHFKEVNDSAGHAAGDAVLDSFGHGVKEVLRDTDVLGRIGGEEFAVLLPGISQEMAMIVTERIRSGAEADQVECGGQPVPYTVSIGLFHTPDSSGEFEDFLRLADKALYRAKEGGRNRVVLDGVDQGVGHSPGRGSDQAGPSELSHPALDGLDDAGVAVQAVDS